MVDVSTTPTPDSSEPTGPPRAEPADSSIAAAARPDNDAPFLWWRRRDQLVFGTLMIAMVVLMGIHWARMSGFGMRPVEIERHEARAYEYKLEINSANWVEWTQLDGIGDQLARRIVSDREEKGPFKSVNDLNRVPGIGPKTIEKLRPWIQAGADIDASSLSGR